MPQARLSKALWTTSFWTCGQKVVQALAGPMANPLYKIERSSAHSARGAGTESFLAAKTFGPGK